MTGGYPDHDLLVHTFLSFLLTILLVYIGRKFIGKQRLSSDSERNKGEIAKKMPVEDEAESSGTPSNPPGFDNYDVFISFRGKDTRNGFTSHLHKDLNQRGMKAFIDSKDLQKGREINDLFKYIERSKIFVPIFSKNYAESKWCLMEITKMVEIADRDKRPIIPVFFDVEPSDVKNQTGSFDIAFRNHKKKKELNKETVDKWRQALRRAGEISGHCLPHGDGNEAKLITVICKEVSIMLSEVPFDIKPIGIDFRIASLKQMLEREEAGVCMIGLCGLGGIGKTTLAMALYNVLFPNYEWYCFLADVRETAKVQGLPFLQAKFLEEVSKERVAINNVERGISLLKRKLVNKKVLLILDDVDHTDQLKAFTAHREKQDQEWFYKGSTIIVTTRDKEVLIKHGLKEEEIHSLEELNLEYSLQLFKRHAIVSDQLTPEFDQLCKETVQVTGGLPLALIVFGCEFYGIRDPKEWRERLKKLKLVPQRDVYAKLKTSYEGLDREEKCIFLDIACFFIKEIKTYPVYMWEACDCFPGITLKVLQHKSLIKINEKDVFEMHDQIRDMGRRIVREEGGDEPVLYSRLWDAKDISTMMDAKVSSESCRTEGISHSSAFRSELGPMEVISSRGHLQLSVSGRDFSECRVQLPLTSTGPFVNINECPLQLFVTPRGSSNINEDRLQLSVPPRGSSNVNVGCSRVGKQLSWNQIEAMRKLRMIIASHEACEEGEIRLPGCTRWLKWSHCPYRTLTFQNKQHEHLVVIQLFKGLFDTLGSNNMVFPNLKVLDLSGCSNLIHTPDFTNLPCLKELHFDGCPSLVEIHESIRHLTNLVFVSLAGCSGISILPKQIGHLKSLERLNLSGTLIEDMSDFIGGLLVLEYLNLENCERLTFLPRQIGDLKKLKHLLLSGTSLATIPDSVGGLQLLEELDLKECKELSVLPKQIGGLKSLKCLYLQQTSIADIPDSLGDMQSMRVLNLSKCESLQELPHSIGKLESLEDLDLSGCTSLRMIPDSLGDMKSMRMLNLSKCESLQEIPDSIGKLESLGDLDLSGCTSLRMIPKTTRKLKSLKHLSLDHCPSLEELPESIIGQLESLEVLHISGGVSLKKVSVYDFNGELKNVRELHLREIEEISVLVGGLPQLEELRVEDSPNLKSLPQLPPSLAKLRLLNCGSFGEMPNVSNLKHLHLLELRSCKGINDLPGLESLHSLRCLLLVRCHSLGWDLMKRLSEASLEQLHHLRIGGASTGSKLQFGIPKGQSRTRIDLAAMFFLVEEPLPKTSLINICVQVTADTKVVFEMERQATRNWREHSEILYSMSFEEEDEMGRCIREGGVLISIPSASQGYQMKMGHFGFGY